MLRTFIVFCLLLFLMCVPVGAATPASYTGSSGGNWNLGTNWSTSPAVPLDSGPTTYDVTINGKTVTFNVAGSSAIDALSLSSATLKLSAGDNLSVASGLTSSTSTINSTGAAFSAGGTTSLSASSLLVSAGGSITLAGLTSYTTTSAGTGTFQVDGATSQLSLANLTTITLASNAFTATAQNAGTFSLPGLTSFSGTGGTFTALLLQANGTGSILRMNALPSLTIAGPTTVQATGGGLTEMTSLTTISNTGDFFGGFNGYADGAGSKVNLPALTGISLSGANGTLRATAGGDFEAGSLATVTPAGGEILNLQATGAGSVLNVAGLGAAAQKQLNVTVGTGGTVNWGNMSILKASSVTLDTAGTLNTSLLTNIDSTSLTATNGAALSIPVTAFASTSLGAATWQATNAASVLLLPNLTSVMLSGNDLTIDATGGGDVELAAVTTLALGTNTLHLTATGTNSKINMPGAPTSLSQVDIQASMGGTIVLGNLTTLQSSSIIVDTADSLPTGTLTNVDASNFTATNGGTLSLPAVASYQTVAGTSVTLQATGTNSLFTMPALLTITNPGDVFSGINIGANGSGAIAAFDALTTVTANAASIAFQAQNGGTIRANALRSIGNMGSIFGSISFSADGANSKVSLNSLSTIALNGATDTLSATTGGDVEAPALVNETITGNIFEELYLTVSGAGSLMNVPQLGTHPLNRVIASLNGGTITWGNPTVMQASSVTIDTSGTIALAQLVNIDSTSFNAANGVTITLPNVTAYGAVAGTGATLQASGANSTLALPALTSITNPGDIFSGLTFGPNGAGSVVALDALTTVTVNASSITFSAQGGGTLRANALTSETNLGSIFGNFNVSATGAGSVVLMNALSAFHLNGAVNNISAAAGGDVELPAITSVTSTGNIFEGLDVSSTGAGSLVDLEGLLSTVPFPDSLAVSNNGELDLGGLHTTFVIAFSADFASSSTGTLDVYVNHILEASIAPNNFGTMEPYIIVVPTAQPGSSTVELIANGTGANVTLQDYIVSVPEPATAGLVGLLAPLWLARRSRRRGAK